MIDDLLSACDNRFQTDRHGRSCDNCTYFGFCPNDICECEKCLELVHFPDRVAVDVPPRQYDCTHMADYYVCKYACRYTSEIAYAFERMRCLKAQRSIKVLSFGCGPCTDLLALDYLRQTGEYQFETLEYRGIDYGQAVWENIHTDLDLCKSAGINVRFFYDDAKVIINQIAKGNWAPDLVVFQYFFSDMNKNSDTSDITDFIQTFAQYANRMMPSGSYIVLNDINLSIRWKGGREYFDRLNDQLQGFESRRAHFNNDRPGRGTFQYGSGSDGEYTDNNLMFKTEHLINYNPFTHCSSAQMLLKRR
jgi:hypothetical protein